MLDQEKQVYINRIQELEERVEQLRISRRILMNILENIDKERQKELHKIKIEHTKLKKTNIRYAYKVMELQGKLSN